jgi:hypothetical protein
MHMKVVNSQKLLLLLAIPIVIELLLAWTVYILFSRGPHRPYLRNSTNARVQTSEGLNKVARLWLAR